MGHEAPGVKAALNTARPDLTLASGVQASSSHKVWKPLWVVEEAQVLQLDTPGLTETWVSSPIKWG